MRTKRNGNCGQWHGRAEAYITRNHLGGVTLGVTPTRLGAHGLQCDIVQTKKYVSRCIQLGNNNAETLNAENKCIVNIARIVALIRYVYWSRRRKDVNASCNGALPKNACRDVPSACH